MNTVCFDSQISDSDRRRQLYQGNIFVFSSLPNVGALCMFTRKLIEEAFSPLDPVEAEYALPTEEYVAILARLKPQFVHHPTCKVLIQKLLVDAGCDPENTYFDVPRLKSIPQAGNHPSGLTYAIHPHRDTWYAAPFCQQNWWMPLYPIDANSALSFHPQYWSKPARNNSSQFNHYVWNKYGRRASVSDPQKYLRDQPRPEESIDARSEVRLVFPVGGCVLFSGAQLHSAVQNTSGRTRFSIDFRTVDVTDVIHKVGAPNVDSAASGTTLRDFLRVSDLTGIPDEVIAPYDTGRDVDGEIIFQPKH